MNLTLWLLRLRILQLPGWLLDPLDEIFQPQCVGLYLVLVNLDNSLRSKTCWDASCPPTLKIKGWRAV